MPNWRDLATLVDKVVVHTFDETGVTLQPVVAGVPTGAPIPIPCEFDPAFVDQVVEAGQTVGLQRTVADIHYADLPPGGVLRSDGSVALADGRFVAPGCRLLVAAPSPNVGTYVIDSMEPNGDKTGVRLRLKRS